MTVTADVQLPTTVAAAPPELLGLWQRSRAVPWDQGRWWPWVSSQSEPFTFLLLLPIV